MLSFLWEFFILFLSTITFDIGNRVTLFERDGLTNGPLTYISVIEIQCNFCIQKTYD